MPLHHQLVSQKRHLKGSLERPEVNDKLWQGNAVVPSLYNDCLRWQGGGAVNIARPGHILRGGDE